MQTCAQVDFVFPLLTPTMLSFRTTQHPPVSSSFDSASVSLSPSQCKNLVCNSLQTGAAQTMAKVSQLMDPCPSVLIRGHTPFPSNFSVSLELLSSGSLDFFILILGICTQTKLSALGKVGVLPSLCQRILNPLFQCTCLPSFSL